MCSIVGSFNPDKIVELCKLNEYRGQVSHSLSLYDIVSGKIHVQKRVGPVDYDEVLSTKKDHLSYMIVHMQAPTTGDFKVANVHPAQYQDRYLWHNGILKQDYIQKLKTQLDEVCEWDTFLMLKALHEDIHAVDKFDGSFACLMYAHEKLYVFRNEISPLFFDRYLNISSTPFADSQSVPANKLMHMDFNFDELFSVHEYNTVTNPYFFAD
jgi:glucosamine 6-phosphate synthetase-like amidotransferase/phosphosugar isomerase protein